MKKVSYFLPIQAILTLILASATNLGGMADQGKFWSYAPTRYLFAPGILCSEYVIGKYCADYIASTGEHVHSKTALELLNGAQATSCNFAEIVLGSAANSNERRFFRSEINNFMQKALEYRFRNYNISIEGSSQNGLTLKPYFINLYNFNIGQSLDIQIISKEYDRCCQDDTLKDIVLYGTSRGAATVFNFIATEYDKKTEKRVKAIILEGCFDAVRNISYFNPFLQLLPYYKKYGLTPLDLVKEFVATCNVHSIPVLVVTSKVDEIVPYKNTMNLCNELSKEGLLNLYVLELNNSGHRDYTCNNGEDMQRYQKVVHAFYKKCNASHNLLLADAGLPELESCKINSN